MDIYEAVLYDRDDMPQVGNIPNTVKKLKDRGFDIKRQKMTPGKMKPSQTTLDMDKVEDISKTIKPEKCDPIVVSMDDHIVDGHHRWAALNHAGHNNDKVVVYRIMLNRRQAIQAFNDEVN